MGFDNVNVNVSGPVQPTSKYKTKILKGNHSFASQITEPNMKYVIKHDFDLGGESVTIPKGCLLEFDGGSLRNGTLVGTNTKIEAGFVQIFYNVIISGIFNTTANIFWFGAKGSGKTSSIQTRNDDTTAIQNAVNSSFYHIFFPIGWYYISSSIVINDEKWLELEGISTKFRARNIETISCASIYIDTDIDIFQVSMSIIGSSKQIRITGGCLDVSKLEENYTKAALHVFCKKSIWRLDISCDILGYAFNGQNNTGIYLDSDNGEDGSGITYVNIFDNVISGLHTGIRIDDYNVNRYITNVVHSGLITNCVKAAYIGGSAHVFKGMYQPGYVYNTRENGEALFDVTAQTVCFEGVIWDINVGENNEYSPQFSVNLYNNCKEIFFNGLCAGSWIYKKLKGNISAATIGKGNLTIFGNTDFLNPQRGDFKSTFIPGSYINFSQYVTDSFISIARLTFENNNDSIFEHLLINYAIDVNGENTAIFSVSICGTKSNFSVTIRQLHGGGSINRTVYVLSDTTQQGSTTLHLCIKKEAGQSGFTDCVKFISPTTYNWESNPVDVTSYNYTQLTSTYLFPKRGSTQVREQIPTLKYNNGGDLFYDRTLGRHVFWDNKSDKWLEEDGAVAGVNRSGTFANKPAADNIYIGFKYFCTDRQTTEGATNGIEIIHKGVGVWVDALGRVVS